MDLQKALEWRYATKEFDSSKKIKNEDFDKILESIRMAPTSFGLQPFRVIIADDKKLREELKKHAWNQSQVTDADKFLVFAGVKNVDEGYIKKYVEMVAETRGLKFDNLRAYYEMMLGFVKSNSKEFMENWAKRQAYIGLGFGLLSAGELGVDACPMEGFNPVGFDEVLELNKQGLSSVVLMALGYRSENDKTSKYKKVRISKEDFFIHK